ncbi:fungal-specific transcription factor domain-containing protein [Fusarium avenaceum]|nr:fungal-specific transcription factor domain-containing protein [Fusarium avenaceum]
MATSVHQSRHKRLSRIRSFRACETCHLKKVRCDALSNGIPCNTCSAFNVKCQVPGIGEHQAKTLTTLGGKRRTTNHTDTSNGHINTPAASSQSFHVHSYHGQVVSLPKFNVSPITNPGQVVYLGESSGFNLLIRGNHGPVVHYPMPHDAVQTPLYAGLDPLEMQILKRRGAFILPPKSLCDDLIETYFTWVQPIVPVIDRTQFMSQYRDATNPPSLLLLQCVLLAGARISTNPQLMKDGSTSTAVATFYRRAKALYDADYERDRITLVQSMLLMGWYWAGPDDISKNMFYWSQSAIVIAQNFGLHRNMDHSNLSITETRLRRRIWWTLFTRDRALAVALGHSVAINLDDCDIDMVTESDFVEHEGIGSHEYPPDPIHVGFFIQYVKLCKLIGLVASKYSKKTQLGQDRTGSNSIGATLSKWLLECPVALRWERSRHHFWSAILHLHYFSACCLLHRASSTRNIRALEDTKQSYGSRDGAVHAASMITSIVEVLSYNQQLLRCSPFIIHSLFSAIVVHLHVSNTPSPSTRRLACRRLGVCLRAIKDLARVWAVGKTVFTMIETISGFNGDKKPTRPSTDFTAGEVFVDLGCACTTDQACTPNIQSQSIDLEDNIQISQCLQEGIKTPAYESNSQASIPVVDELATQISKDDGYLQQSTPFEPTTQIDFNTLLPDWTAPSEPMPSIFYSEDTANTYIPIPEATVPTWDQFQLGCQQDYGISVPWDLVLDLEWLTKPNSGTFYNKPDSDYGTKIVELDGAYPTNETTRNHDYGVFSNMAVDL